MTTEEKPMCTYDCEQCNKTYKDVLYPDDPSNCIYCPDCKEKNAEIEAIKVTISMAKNCLSADSFFRLCELLRLVFEAKNYVKLPEM